MSQYPLRHAQPSSDGYVNGYNGHGHDYDDRATGSTAGFASRERRAGGYGNIDNAPLPRERDAQRSQTSQFGPPVLDSSNGGWEQRSRGDNHDRNGLENGRNVRSGVGQGSRQIEGQQCRVVRLICLSAPVIYCQTRSLQPLLLPNLPCLKFTHSSPCDAAGSFPSICS